jgi:hypothetical protein
MKLSAVAQYIEDGDILLVTVYVIDGNAYKPGLIASGTCSLVQGTTVTDVATFDRYYGNSDGPVKIAYNHPTLTAGSVRVSITLQDGTLLEDILTIQRIKAPDANVVPNNSGLP